ncbi:MAG: lamin tail domain-containing protein [Acholeplasmatales bacterium]|nr:lamin tail domain-containing protein [Acholeplasmatales bacterium]
MKKLLSILSISGIVILASCYGGKAQTTTTNTTTTSEVTPTTTSSTTTAEPTTSNTEPVATSTEPVVNTTSEPVTTTTDEPTVTTTEHVTTTTDVTTTTTQAETIDYANELFISEFYNISFKPNVYTVANSNNNKALELYNPSNNEIDLSNYTIILYSNKQNKELKLSGTVPAKTCYTLVNSYALDFLKVNADKLDEVYIGDKTRIGLYKNGQLIDVFGDINTPVENGEDYVINGVASATDTNNITRNDGARGSVTFVDTDWTVSRDGDGSTLGIHEDDQTNNSVAKTDEEIKTYFDNFVLENYIDDEGFSGEKIELITEKDGYTFEYEFLYSDDVIQQDGTINWDYMKNYTSGYYTITVAIKMKDANGKLLYESNYDDIDSYGYILILVAE